VATHFGSKYSRKAQIASFVAAHLALTAARDTAASVTKLVSEERAIAASARNIAGAETITQRDQLVAIHAFIGKALSGDPDFRFLPRPFLRQSAVESLRSRQGFCGESARVAVLVLGALGIRANRIYLIGERWNHVIVEHEWLDGDWYMFDAFPDPATMMTPEQLCSFGSDDPTSFPNVHEGNPWVDFYRWRPLLVRGISKSRPPASYVRITERPDAIRAGLSGLKAGGALAAAALTVGFASAPR
jgi:hypothetical protein